MFAVFYILAIKPIFLARRFFAKQGLRLWLAHLSGCWQYGLAGLFQARGALVEPTHDRINPLSPADYRH